MGTPHKYLRLAPDSTSQPAAVDAELKGGAFSKARWSQDGTATLYTVVNLKAREEGHLLLYKQVGVVYCLPAPHMHEGAWLKASPVIRGKLQSLL